MISSNTSFLALIGNPVSHSLSPIMQNAAIKYLGLDLVYLALPCKPDDFNSVINTLKKINCKGLNITIPFKEKAFKLCNEISPIASKVKAINTLKLNKNNEWSATNTDIDGFTYPLKKFKLTNKKGTILGSGGAARAAVQGLLNLNLSEINVISRNKNSLARLLKDFEEDFMSIYSPKSSKSTVSEVNIASPSSTIWLIRLIMCALGPSLFSLASSIWPANL